MSVYVYWNSNDKDCKKIFHFMSSEDSQSIIQTIKEKNEIYVDRKYMHFSDDSNVMKYIKNAEVVIFCTHGTAEEILKYRNNPDKPYEEYILIDKNNMEVLEGKIILAFCCSSAKILGELCVNNPNPCKAYVGFRSDIVYDNGSAKKSRHLIYESYKKAFSKSLKYAVRTKCTIEQFKVSLLLYMRRESVKAILESDNHSLNTMYAGTMNGLVALGNKEAKLFA